MQSYYEGNPYQDIGGADTIRNLVEAFYPKVIQDPDLSPIFPEDIDPVKEKQYLFLTQFFGGPPLYSEKHGHPMLRARHMPFPITPRRAKAWLRCMSEAMDEIGLEGPVREYMFQRLTMTAYHMVNRQDQETS
ncbi:MAG: globin [Bacillaceae bacterium]|nr:globin [Bacillaceae bacterium]